ncbi:helix-turn-helix transcriptional regulator [Demequina litorisediminis]|uniref:Transcription regulator PadR N-terminal domain-containing protein n=1 Tax=Demequina litorisediminis TaxID=1849022 RepID=A0ABQ6IGK1_9MICO|nr:hypothetical protein GCM10025876_30780 [Demequina litorisediminis]
MAIASSAASQSLGLNVEANTLYPLLRRLDKQGLLTFDWDTSEARPRKIYATSPAGIEPRLAAARRLEPPLRGTRPDGPTMTLTDRYVAATLARLAEDQRSDVEAQLREAIGDAIDARIGAGLTAGQAERDTLNEMGDPERLAASYADRSLFLIGPEYFLAWKRLTTLLLWIVLPIMAVLIPLGGWIDGDGVGAIIGTTVGGTLTVGVHLVFWVTLVFAAIERGRVKASEVTEPWTVDRLPEERDATVTWGDTAGTVVVIALTTVALVWQQRGRGPAQPTARACRCSTPRCGRSCCPHCWSRWASSSRPPSRVICGATGPCATGG